MKMKIERQSGLEDEQADKHNNKKKANKSQIGWYWYHYHHTTKCIIKITIKDGSGVSAEKNMQTIHFFVLLTCHDFFVNKTSKNSERIRFLATYKKTEADKNKKQK